MRLQGVSGLVWSPSVLSRNAWPLTNSQMQPSQCCTLIKTPASDPNALTQGQLASFAAVLLLQRHALAETEAMLTVA